MPISTQRAKKACQAVIVDDSERSRLLGRHDIIKVLESPFLSEDDNDIYIVDFLKNNVAGEIRIFTLSLPCMVTCPARLSFLLFILPH